MKATLVLELARGHAAAPIDVAPFPAVEPRRAASRRRSGSPDTLLFTFMCGTLATVAAVTTLARGGALALLASIALLLVLTGVVLRATFSLLDDDNGDGNGRGRR